MTHTRKENALETTFRHEIDWIQNSQIKSFAEHAVSKLPEYFFRVAASSTGKYHPSYALGEGGLVRHTKAAVALAKDLLGLEMYGKYTPDECDLILVALILHDGFKHGATESRYTLASHPTDCTEQIKAFDWEQYLTKEQFDVLCSCIASHMGQWNTDYRTKKEILPKPKTAMEKFVHQCDYLASRKYLEVNFEAINYEGDRV